MILVCSAETPLTECEKITERLAMRTWPSQRMAVFLRASDQLEPVRGKPSR